MRAEGYYWVKSNGEWVIADWDGLSFWLFEWQHEFDESDFDEVNEKQIVRASDER
jgi:hypothetical protein